MINKKVISTFAPIGCGMFVLSVSIYAAIIFNPISIKSESASIELSVLGTYQGGIYSRATPASPPGYDAQTKRLFVGSVDRRAVDVLGISDPFNPIKLFEIDLKPFLEPNGITEPNSLDVHKGLVAVSIKNTGQQPESGAVVIFNAEGDLVTDPIKIETLDGIQVLGRIAFTPNGQQLVISTRLSKSPISATTTTSKPNFSPSVCASTVLTPQPLHKT